MQNNTPFYGCRGLQPGSGMNAINEVTLVTHLFLVLVINNKINFPRKLSLFCLHWKQLIELATLFKVTNFVFLFLCCVYYSRTSFCLSMTTYIPDWLCQSMCFFPHIIHTIDYRWKLISKARIMASCNTFLAFYEKKKNNFFFLVNDYFFFFADINTSQGEKLGDWGLFCELTWYIVCGVCHKFVQHYVNI